MVMFTRCGVAFYVTSVTMEALAVTPGHTASLLCDLRHTWQSTGQRRRKAETVGRHQRGSSTLQLYGTWWVQHFVLCWIKRRRGNSGPTNYCVSIIFDVRVLLLSWHCWCSNQWWTLYSKYEKRKKNSLLKAFKFIMVNIIIKQV